MGDRAEIERLTNELSELVPADESDPLLQRAYDFRIGKISNHYPVADEVTTVNMLLKALRQRIAEIYAARLE